MPSHYPFHACVLTHCLQATETAVTKAVESALKASEKRQAEEVSRAVRQ
jgi:hypothetical protein